MSIIGEYVDMVKVGIIDPLKVIRTALVDAARYCLVPVCARDYFSYPPTMSDVKDNGSVGIHSKLDTSTNVPKLIVFINLAVYHL
jgi:hypothetical protein